jgi:lipopolysaccharide transport protein LptA
MSPRKRRGDYKLKAARLIRPVLVILLAMIVLVILGYLVRQMLQSRRTEPPLKIIGQKKVEQREQVRVSQYHKNKGLIEAKGDRNYPQDENTMRLEGHVEVLDRGRQGGREIKMTGDLLTYDKDMTHFFFKGNVRIQFKNVTIEGPEFEYNRAEDFMKTSSGVKIDSPTFIGSSKKALFFVKDEGLILEEDLQLTFRLRLRTADGAGALARTPAPAGAPGFARESTSAAKARPLTSEPFVLTGNKLTYAFRERRGNMEGNLDIIHGRSHGTADQVFFELFDKTEELRILRISGGVKLNLDEPRKAAKKPLAEKAAPPSQVQEPSINREFRLDLSVRQAVESDDIKLQAYLNKPLLRLIECRGHSSIKFDFDSGEATRIQGDDLDLNFNTDGSFQALSVVREAGISALDKDGKIVRQIEGTAMALDVENRVLRVGAEESRKARIVSSQSDVSGNEISILIRLDDFEAKGNVQMNFLPSPTGGEDRGFFSREKPIFATAQGLRYSSQSKRFLLWERVRTWQDKRMLSAQEIIVAEDAGDITCQGGVQSAFPYTPKGKDKEQRVEISAGKMRFDHESNQVIYENNCIMKSGAAVLQCGLIAVNPGIGGGEVRSMRAVKGNAKAVTIVMNEKEGTGEIAEYDVEKDTITLTGQPELKEKDKGTVKGDKLTFYLTDGKILVETRDQERPVPVIKS